MPTLRGYGHTIEDRIVLDGISATNLIGEHAGSYYGGGMAVQSYTPRRIHRQTIDLDNTVAASLTYDEFKHLFSPVRDALNEMGYDVSFSQSRRTYDLEVSGKGSSLVIQAGRRNRANYERNRKRIEREFANAYKGEVYGVPFMRLRPEDIVLQKSSRIVACTSGQFPYEQLSRIPPMGKPLEEQLGELMDFRASLLRMFDNLECIDFQLFRVFVDFFDVRALLGATAFDKQYYNAWFKDSEWLSRDEMETKKRLALVHPMLVD